MGDVHHNKSGLLYSVIEIVNSKKIKVRFEKTGYEVYATGENVRAGNIKDRLHRSVIGGGYLGDNISGVKNTKVGRTWCQMMDRCYSEININYKAYGAKGVTVCEEWKNFSVFEKWYENYEYKPEDWHLDKDLLSPEGGPKVYSPETCCFIPHKINILIRDVSFDDYGVLPSKGDKDAARKYLSRALGKGEDKFGGNQYFTSKEDAVTNSLFKKGLKLYDTLLIWGDKLPLRVQTAIKEHCKKLMCYQKHIRSISA